MTVIEKEGVYESSLYPSPELLAIALDQPRWGENEHIQALYSSWDAHIIMCSMISLG